MTNDKYDKELNKMMHRIEKTGNEAGGFVPVSIKGIEQLNKNTNESGLTNTRIGFSGTARQYHKDVGVGDFDTGKWAGIKYFVGDSGTIYNKWEVAHEKLKQAREDGLFPGFNPYNANFIVQDKFGRVKYAESPRGNKSFVRY